MERPYRNNHRAGKPGHKVHMILSCAVLLIMIDVLSTDRTEHHSSLPTTRKYQRSVDGEYVTGRQDIRSHLIHNEHPTCAEQTCIEYSSVNHLGFTRLKTLRLSLYLYGSVETCLVGTL